MVTVRKERGIHILLMVSRNLRYRFFYRNGIKPLMVNLREHFEPHFSVSHKYFSKPDAEGNVLGNVIELRWV